MGLAVRWPEAAALLVLMLIGVAIAAIRPVMDPDCWFHMAYGKLALATGAIPRSDVFSHTAQGQPWTSSGWLSSILLYVTERTFGLHALSFVPALVVGIAYSLIFCAGVIWYRSALTVTLFLAVAIWDGYIRFTPRPEVFSQLFLAAVLLILVRASDLIPQSPKFRVPRYLWSVPALLALWSNFHAGVLMGVACAVLFFLMLLAGGWNRFGRSERLQLVALASLSAFCWLANPYGAGSIELASRIKSMPFMKDQIMEWMPALSSKGAQLPAGSYFGLFVLAGLAAAAIAARLSIAGSDSAAGSNSAWMTGWRCLMIAGFAALPFFERRHQALMAVAIPALALPDMPMLEGVLRRFRIVAIAAVVLLTGTFAVMQKSGKLHVGKGIFNTQPDTELLPTVAGEFLKRNRPPENLFNTYGPGGYLLWLIGPESKVFIDGRLDVYKEETWRDYLDAESGDLTPEEMSAKYHVNSAFIYIKGRHGLGEALAPRLARSPNWGLCYFDDSYALFVRKAPENSTYLAQHEYQFVSPFDLTKLTAASSARDLQALQSEIKRAVETSQGSARAHLVASVFARNSGDNETAEKELAAAKAKNPSIRTERR